MVSPHRSHSPKEPRKLPGHAQLLRAGRQLERLDPGRHPRGMAGHSCEPQIGRRRRQLAEQVLDVSLVAGPLAAEHVGVDEDVDHAAASR